MLSYEQALAYLHGRPRFAPQPGLCRMRRLLDALGNPERRPRFVHVAGTNGKGSTTVLAASILASAGFKTGTYISPHLDRVEERISVNGVPVSASRAAELASRVAQAADRLGPAYSGQLIQFEVLTAMAFLEFAAEDCDLVALEVGLGGRYDATNVISAPLAAVITSIGLDHTEVLGETLAAIAAEKAGIVKPGAPLVTAVREPEALRPIELAAEERGAVLWRVGPAHGAFGANGRGAGVREVTWQRNSFGPEGQSFDLHLPPAAAEGQGLAVSDLRIALHGRHQLDNAACAVAAVHAMRRAGRDVPEAAIRAGLLRARWPGRFEILRSRPWAVADGAHNPPGARALRATFEELFPGRRPVLVLGLLADKAAGAVVAELAPLARTVIATRPNHPTRALDAGALAEAVRAAGAEVSVVEPQAEAMRRGLASLRGEEDVLLVTGSLYLMAEARAILGGA